MSRRRISRPGAPDTWLSRLAAAPSGAISHRSGSALYGLPGGRTDLIELTCVRWRRAQREQLIVHESRRLDLDDIKHVEGIPVTCAERILMDLAMQRPSPNFLESVIQSARRKRLITFESTVEYFERHARRGLRGTRAVRTALERWDPGSRATESEMETLLIQVLREHGCPEPTVQFEVRNGRGRSLLASMPQFPSGASRSNTTASRSTPTSSRSGEMHTAATA